MLPVAHMLPRQRQVLARFSVSALVASLPLLYVSLRRPPPAALAGDSAFWFLMSNCVIAAIVAADDAGTLFFGSKADRSSCCHSDGDTINISSYMAGGQQPAVAFEDSRGPVVPFLSSNDDAPTAVHLDGGRIQDELASRMASSNSIVDGALLPFSVHGEGDEVDQDASSQSSTDGVRHASVLRRGHGDDQVEGQGGGGEEARRSAASDEAVPDADELAIMKAERAWARPELEPGLVEEEDEIPEAWAKAQRSRTPDLRQGKGAVAAGEGKLRRSVTEGSKSAAAEESEYWELSDEELNRRVEEFIARFNREMRRQIEEEAGV